MVHLENYPAYPRGEADIIIVINFLKYFPKKKYSLPSGLTIFKSTFINFDGSFGVVAGPTTVRCDNMGQIAHSHVAIPEDIENLENPKYNSNTLPNSTLNLSNSPISPTNCINLENAGTNLKSRRHRKRRSKRKNRNPLKYREKSVLTKFCKKFVHTIFQ